MATPFAEDNTVDIESLRRYTRSVIDKGSSGILYPAMAAEVAALSPEERVAVVRTVIEATAGRIPVIGGATADDQQGRMQAGADLLELGCDGILAYIPYVGTESYESDVKELASLEPGVLMLQDLSQTEADLPVAVIAKLFEEVESFTWIKVETLDRNLKFTAIRDATGGRLNIGSAGYGMIEALDRGVRAWMPTLYHDIYGRVFDYYRAGRRDEAVELFDKLIPCLVLPAFQKGVTHVRNKMMLQREGIFTTTVTRTGLSDLDEYTRRQIDACIEHALALSRSLA